MLITTAPACLRTIIFLLILLPLGAVSNGTGQGETIPGKMDNSGELNLKGHSGAEAGSAVDGPGSHLDTRRNSKAEEYRGIWYRLGRDYEYGDKYSGGLGTYTANHKPLAVYSEEANKTFFVLGGTPTEEQQYLLILAGAYDHDSHKVSRPTIVYDKGAEGVYDAHDNASITLDADGYVWVFVAGRNVIRDGTLLRQRYLPLLFHEIHQAPSFVFLIKSGW